MSNEFDLERAKAGDTIEFLDRTKNKWVPVRFVGKRRRGTFIVENETDEMIHVASDYASEVLRMAAKAVKVRYRNYMLKDAVHVSVSMIADTPGYETPEGIEKKSWFKGWIHTEWQEVEVPQ